MVISMINGAPILSQKVQGCDTLSVTPSNISTVMEKMECDREES